MKKVCLLFFMSFALGTAAFADHQGMGIGIIGSWGWNWGYPSYGSAGLSLKVPKMPIYWGIYPAFYGHNFGIGATGDFYIIDKNLVTSTLTNEDGNYNLKLDWYLGIGAFMNLSFWGNGADWDGDAEWENGANFSFGARVPIGLSWHIIRQLELLFDIAPGIGVSFNPGGAWGPYFAGAIELGLRFWM